MMTGCLNVTYHEAINIALSSEEEEYRKHKEAKKKKICHMDLLVAIKSARR
jgi:hypothetical protein